MRVWMLYRLHRVELLQVNLCWVATILMLESEKVTSERQLYRYNQQEVVTC
uniref:Uncharacterized protein n=1 Tax=uncultured marine virus TaxID=186617 RepID=A0A0F7L3E9_9VIRU|nr:hypothetical protein [uncultured marine virus]